MMYESEDHRKEQKQGHLKNLKTKNNILSTVVAVLFTALISIFSGFVVKYSIDMMNVPSLAEE